MDGPTIETAQSATALRDAAAAQPPLLALRHVRKSFADGTVALEDLSLAFQRGAFVSLLGPSGCGKSTALRLIAGLSRPSAGSIHWAEPGDSADLGFVFQDPTLMPWATVFENLYLPFRLQGRSRRAVADQIHAAIGQVGLAGFEKSYPRALSGGMRMRVSIARALVTRPKLLLMDEPFAALDEITRFKLNEDLLRLKDQLRCTVIFVTHSVFEAVFLSDRIAVMAARPGRVVETLEIGGPARRDDAFRTSAEYAAFTRTASEALRRAMEAPR